MITNIGSDYETPKFSSNDYIHNTINFLSSEINFDPKSYITHCLINNPLVKIIMQNRSLVKI